MEKEGVWMALPIAIVEDQTPDAQRLEELLQQQLPEAECTWFACGDDFLRAAAEPGLYAVVFLDICMAGTNGIETARRLRQADPEVLIVFVTSSPEYVWDAFPVHPFDYLLKPYQEEKFVHLAAELRHRGKRVLCIDADGGLRNLDITFSCRCARCCMPLPGTTTSLSPPRMVSTAPCAALRRSKKSLPHGKTL